VTTRGRTRKALIVTAVVLLGVPAAVILGLLAWDGDFPEGDQRVLLPGVQLDLRTAETARGPVEYDLYGSSGPVVLSVHAGLGGADQGRLFAAWLQDDGFRILSPSRPGYLGTPLSSGRTPAEQADLLAALLDELRIERVGVLAASAGAPVAYTFAARHPERVWGLVSVGGTSRPVGGTPSPGSPARTAFMNTIGQKLVKLTAKVSLGTIAAGTLDETSTFTAEQKAQRTTHITDTPQVREFFRAMFGTTFPYEERMPGTRNDSEQARATTPLPLAQVTAPSLIVHGTQDGDVPFEDGVHAAGQIPGAQHHWMEDDDHLGFWLSPAAGDAQAVARRFLLHHSSGR
jgi:pimeloyl-ACP methyl ester carboxylesterase